MSSIKTRPKTANPTDVVRSISWVNQQREWHFYDIESDLFHLIVDFFLVHFHEMLLHVSSPQHIWYVLLQAKIINEFKKGTSYPFQQPDG